MSNEQEKLNIKTTEIELPPFDCTPYIGKRTNIMTVELRKGGVFDGKQTYFYLATTEALDVINDKEVTAKKIYNLHSDKVGTLGWTKDSDMANDLRKFKAQTPEKLIGKEVIIQTVLNKKKGKEFLTF